MPATLPPGTFALYPRGIGASTGPMPATYVMVCRWIDIAEARLWMANGGTAIPGDAGRGNGVFVTLPGEAKPGGTGPIRVDFGVPQAALQTAGKVGWHRMFQPLGSRPIYNVTIFAPDAGTAAKIKA